MPYAKSIVHHSDPFASLATGDAFCQNALAQGTADAWLMPSAFARVMVLENGCRDYVIVPALDIFKNSISFMLRESDRVLANQISAAYTYLYKVELGNQLIPILIAIVTTLCI